MFFKWYFFFFCIPLLPVYLIPVNDDEAFLKKIDHISFNVLCMINTWKLIGASVTTNNFSSNLFYFTVKLTWFIKWWIAEKIFNEIAKSERVFSSIKNFDTLKVVKNLWVFIKPLWERKKNLHYTCEGKNIGPGRDPHCKQKFVHKFFFHNYRTIFHEFLRFNITYRISFFLKV